MSPDEQIDEEAQQKRDELRRMSQEERVRRARELAEQMRRQKAAERAQAAPSPATKAPAPPPEPAPTPVAEETQQAVPPPAAAKAPAMPSPAAEGVAAQATPPRPAPARPARPEHREREVEPPIVPPEPGTVYDLFKEALPDVEFVATQGVLDVILMVNREDIYRVLKTAKEDHRLAFDYLRNLCGVDQRERGLEVVYHLYSFKYGHNVTIKTIAPLDDPHIPSATSIWKAADWHEREAAEMYGFVFDGHPNLVPLLLEEGLGYYPLRKEHPLAEIEEHQSALVGEGAGGAELEE